MFGRRKEEPSKKRRPNAGEGLSQFGLMDVDMAIGGMDPTGDVDNGDEDDDALEAELLALTSDSGPARPPRRAPPKKPASVNLDAMIAASLKDVHSDEELSGDEDDPDLLNELSALNEEEEEAPPPVAVAPPKPEQQAGDLVTMLSERLKMYQEAETNAKTSGDSTRARRLGRGIKTLTGLLKQAKAGRVVNEEDIPPPVAVSVSKKPPEADSEADNTVIEEPAVPSRPAPPPPEPTPPTTPSKPPSPPPQEKPAPNTEVLSALLARRDEFKRAAVAAKKAGDTDTALGYVKIAKMFEPVITAVLNGEAVDLADMPPSPGSDPFVPIVTAPGHQEEQEGEGTSDDPPAPATVKEALEQRLDKYRSVQKAAEEEGNSSKARRTGRIVKQYEDALKLHRAGKPIPVEDLPTPPGFAPIPQEGGLAPPANPIRNVSPAPPSPRPPATPSPAPPTRAPVPTTSTGEASAQKPNVRKNLQSRQEKQLATLLARQKEFKEAALEAKKKGEINQAKEYLRLAKGFDPLIEASHSGLPVDMDTVPLPPGAKVPVESDFDIVSAEDCFPEDEEDVEDVYDMLELDLVKQVRMCLRTRDHFSAMGDVSSANRFERLAMHSKKDLDTLRAAKKRSDPVPKFRYEAKKFCIVQCSSDLGDNDFELTIVQGINYTVPNPKDVDTYVVFEFPYPSENPPKDRTPLVKDTNNPEYNATFPLTIHRNSRACRRMFKRHGIKLEVWSRGGFLRSDTLIGTAIVKLLPLETQCVLHDSYDLMDGRKAVGGKLEVKIRIRNPIATKEVKELNEKWLILG